MVKDVNVGSLLDLALCVSIARAPGLSERWIRALSSLAGSFGAGGLLRYQSDYRIDLLLRALEAETSQTVLQPQQSGQPSLAFDVQGTLSRYWLMSSYELLRVAKNSELGKGNDGLKALYAKFQLVRVPITKLEIAEDRKLGGVITLETIGEGEPRLSEYDPKKKPKVPFHPEMRICTATGSIGWRLFWPDTRQEVVLYRQHLSDELLALGESI